MEVEKHMETKTIWQSKTFWFNIVSLILAIAAVVQTNPLFTDKQTVLEVLGIVTTVGNVILRFITNTGVTLK